MSVNVEKRELPYAEDVNYWKTSKSSADTWITQTREIIEGFGGKVEQYIFGEDTRTGQAAFMLGWSINGDRFKIVWPVLPTKSGNERAARVQAATFLHHDCKAKAIAATILGHRVAFFNQLLLPDGRLASEVADNELVKMIPTNLDHPRLEDHSR